MTTTRTNCKTTNRVLNYLAKIPSVQVLSADGITSEVDGEIKLDESFCVQVSRNEIGLVRKIETPDGYPVYAFFKTRPITAKGVREMVNEYHELRQRAN